MTKARDLANAGTALTTLSATELGYLDGVTSAAGIGTGGNGWEFKWNCTAICNRLWLWRRRSL
jgi:hypothetical protein